MAGDAGLRSLSPKPVTETFKQLQGFDPPRYRLRIGDWRSIFRKHRDDAIEALRNRKDAYR